MRSYFLKRFVGWRAVSPWGKRNQPGVLSGTSARWLPALSSSPEEVMHRGVRLCQPARIAEETGACWQGLACPCVGAAPGAVTPGGRREAQNADPGEKLHEVLHVLPPLLPSDLLVNCLVSSNEDNDQMLDFLPMGKVVIPKSPLPASEVNSEKPSMHSSTKTVLGHQQGQRRRKTGKKRGRTTKALIHHPMPTPSKSVEPLKFPRKRGPKPGSKRKPRTLLNPAPTSPTTSTPEPDTSTVPQDAATIPSSAMQAPTVCIYLNKNGSTGPHLDKKKVQQLPDHFGPARASVVLQQAVQACIDCAYHQKTVFSFLKQGHGGEVISAVFDREQHTLNLPAVNSITYVLRFLEKLCHNLRSDNLFGNQPFTQNSHMQRAHEYDHDRYLPDRSSSLDGTLQGPGRGTKRYSQDSPPYSAPLSPKLPKNDRHPLEGETFVLGDGLPGPLEPRLDPMDSALNSVNSSSHSRSSRDYRLQGYRHLHQPSSLTQGSTSALRRLSSGGSDRYLGSRDVSRLSSRDPSSWTVEEVMQFIREADPQLGPHADLFRKHEIDGKALLLLRSDMMMKYMGLKLGPALKLTYHIDKLKQGKF
ncbi:polycomb protein SCMH1 isoform X6 [Grus americana]|uniref:polycomb protein SCMH1 isoform X6 n=1 Tax=Grus americana TaxID=9117 RepID=UPI002407FC12|nr:polycomb protein SCMH1 isoform X6 [Grus americana]